MLGLQVIGEQRTPPLAVGDPAPRFTLPASTGESISLDDCLARGPVVLLWYVFDFGKV
jgi:peroxiredoxin